MNKTLLAAALVLLASPALASPTLRADVTVSGAVVTIGDMFEDAGDLAATAIFRAPAPGTMGVVALADVEHAASLAGLSDFDTLGLDSVRVARAATVIDAVYLDGLIEQSLKAKGLLPDGATAAVTFTRTDFALNAEAVANPATLVDLRYAVGSKPFTARFTIAGYSQPIDLSGTIEMMTTAPRLVGTHPAGTVLSAADFEMASVPLATADAGGYADLDQLVGKQLIRQSRGGILLKPTDVRDPIVVSRNELVTVLLRAGAMTLTVKGSALGAASAGEPIDVLNIVTKKILHGIARADGSVEIVTATVAAL